MRYDNNGWVEFIPIFTSVWLTCSCNASISLQYSFVTLAKWIQYPVEIHDQRLHTCSKATQTCSRGWQFIIAAHWGAIQIYCLAFSWLREQRDKRACHCPFVSCFIASHGCATFSFYSFFLSFYSRATRLYRSLCWLIRRSVGPKSLHFFDWI